VLEEPGLSVDVMLIVSLTPPRLDVSTSQNNSTIIELDTKQLLSKMIHQASRVVAVVIELANTSSIVPESKLCRSSSFLVMPPPSTRPGQLKGLEMLSQVAAELDVKSHAPSTLVWASHEPGLLAEQCLVVSDDEVEQGPSQLSHLSPEQCASIVDGVFGELDDDFCLGPPAKRFKSGECSDEDGLAKISYDEQ
jgi:hypothetical protein